MGLDVKAGIAAVELTAYDIGVRDLGNVHSGLAVVGCDRAAPIRRHFGGQAPAGPSAQDIHGAN